jgi:hypothetical protein
MSDEEGVQESRSCRSSGQKTSGTTPLLYNVLLYSINCSMNRPAQSFRDLIVWQRAHEFVLRTYELTKEFPREEQYCLTPQLRRAAISIPANIAEGFKKRGIPDKNRFFNVSQGSSGIIRTDFE